MLTRQVNMFKKAVGRRSFSAAALPRQEVYKIAKEVHAQVWDPAKEPGIFVYNVF